MYIYQILLNVSRTENQWWTFSSVNTMSPTCHCLVAGEWGRYLPNKSQNCQPQKLLFCTMNFGGIKAMACLWSLFIIAFNWLEQQFKGKVREHRLSCVWRVSHSTDATQWSHMSFHPPVGSGWDAWRDCFLIRCPLMVLALSKIGRASQEIFLVETVQCNAFCREVAAKQVKWLQ